MRAGHVAYESCGIRVEDSTGGCDIKRSSSRAADDHERMCGCPEARLRNADNRDANGVRDVRSESWPAEGVKSGVTVND